MRQIWKIILGIGLGIATTHAHAANLYITENPMALTIPRDHIQLSMGYVFERSHQFFSNNGSSGEFVGFEAVDHALVFRLGYGLTRRITLGFEFPFKYRSEVVTDVPTVSSAGLGDSAFFLRWRYCEPTAGGYAGALALGAKFPTGGTQTLSDDGSAKLPLGNAQYEWTGGVQNRWLFGDGWQAALDAFYTYRWSAVAEYLIVSLADSSGSVPIGNAVIDMGDEVKVRMGLARSIGRSFTLGLFSTTRYQFTTQVNSSDIPYINPILDSGTTDSSGYVTTMDPVLMWQLNPAVQLMISGSIPIMGKRYPVVSLMDVSGLIGPVGGYVGVSWGME